MTAPTGWRVLAVLGITVLLAGCSGSVVGGSATTTTGLAQSDSGGRLTASLSLQDGALMVVPAPASEAPAMTSADAIKAARSLRRAPTPPAATLCRSAHQGALSDTRFRWSVSVGCGAR